jgi:predicted phage-related endonuclease
MTDSVDLESVRAQVLLLRWIKSRQAELKELEAAARGAVEDAMGHRSIGLLDGEEVIRWGSHKRTSFDQKAFGDAHPDLLEAYRTSREVRRFEVIEVEDDDD